MHRFDPGSLVDGLVVGRVGRVGRSLRATLLLHVTESPGEVLVGPLFIGRVSMRAPAVQSNEQTNLHS